MKKMLLLFSLLFTASAAVLKDLQASCEARMMGTRKHRFFGGIREDLISHINKIKTEFYEHLRRARTCEELAALMLEYDGIVHVFPLMARAISSDDTVIDVLIEAHNCLTLLFEERCREILPYELKQVEDTAIRNIEDTEKTDKHQILKTFKDAISMLRHYAFSHCTGPCGEFNDQVERDVVSADKNVSKAYRDNAHKKSISY